MITKEEALEVINTSGDAPMDLGIALGFTNPEEFDESFSNIKEALQEATFDEDVIEDFLIEVQFYASK